LLRQRTALVTTAVELLKGPNNPVLPVDLLSEEGVIDKTNHGPQGAGNE
jgi:hypothetical protein